MKTGVFYFLIFFLFASTQAAEIRTWEDTQGNRYEAEFIRELFDKVTLRDMQGKEYRIAVEDFSEHDQKYLRVEVPPVVKFDVRTTITVPPKPEENWDMDNDKIKNFRSKVRVEKVSRRLFTSRIRAEIFHIAKEIDGENYVLLGKTESSFLLGEHNDNMHTFTSDPVQTKVYTEYTGVDQRGWEYIGYVLAISDKLGNITQVESEVKWLEDKVPQLRELYTRGAVSVYSRHFDKETVQKTKVPRPTYMTTRHR